MVSAGEARRAPLIALGALCPRKRWESFTRSHFRREQLEELAERAPPFMVSGAIFFTLMALADWFFPFRTGLPAAFRIHTLTAGAFCVAVMVAGRLTLAWAKRRGRTAVVAIVYAIVVEVAIVYYLLVYAMGVGGTYAHLTAAGALVMMIFVRTIILPMSWRQAVVTNCLIWSFYPIAWSVDRMVCGVAPAPPSEYPDLVYATVVSFAAGSIVFGAVGSHVLFGMRRRTFEASEAARYHIEDKIGSGGMGDVFLARHGTLKAECAVKICRIPAGADPQAVTRRFEREAQQVARLTHPNIVRVFDFGEMEDGSLYFAMERLRGVDLETFLQRHGPVPEDRLLCWMDQALRALEHAHAQGLVHRDLKPGNLFLADCGGEPDFVKVLDFGLAKVMWEGDGKKLTQAGDTAGTPWYMSPEQAQGRTALDHRADLYALGAVMFHLASGKPLFDAESPVGVMVQHVTEPPPPLRSVAPGVSPETEAVVARLLAKKPDDRFAGAREAREALRASPSWGRFTREKAIEWWASHGDKQVALPEVAQAETLPAAPPAG